MLGDFGVFRISSDVNVFDVAGTEDGEDCRSEDIVGLVCIDDTGLVNDASTRLTLTSMTVEAASMDNDKISLNNLLQYLT